MNTEPTHRNPTGVEVVPAAEETTEHISGARAYSAPDTPPDEDMSAAGYLAAEVQQARLALHRTRIIGLAILVLVGGELLYITARFAGNLRPHAAAEIADGMIMQQITDKGPDLAEQLKQKVPQYIEQTPDYALQQLPQYRVAMEDRLEQQLNHYCQATSQQLGQQLDSYLDTHKAQIKDLLTNGNDPQVTRQVGLDLKQQLLRYIQDKPAGGESIKEQLDTSLAALQGTAEKLHHLATAKNLTSQERQTRRALAILTQSIDQR
jgi:uncharacterized protein YicC (UPF0701 family)